MTFLLTVSAFLLGAEAALFAVAFWLFLKETAHDYP